MMAMTTSNSIRVNPARTSDPEICLRHSEAAPILFASSDMIVRPARYGR